MGMGTPSPGRKVRMRLGAVVVILVAAGIAVGLAARRQQQILLRERTLQEQKSADAASRKMREQALEAQRILGSIVEGEEFSSMDALKQERLLAKLLRESPALLELSVADADGRENVRMGRNIGDAPELRDLNLQAPFRKAMRGKPFVGAVYAARVFTLALPILRTGKPKGVLLAVLAAEAEAPLKL